MGAFKGLIVKMVLHVVVCRFGTEPLVAAGDETFAPVLSLHVLVELVKGGKGVAAERALE